MLAIIVANVRRRRARTFLTAAGIAMVVSGHSHRPKICRRRGVLYVNPGSIGPRRFGLPISFVKVAFVEGEFAVDLVHLEEGISG